MPTMGTTYSLYDFRSGRSGDRAIHVVEVAAIGTVFIGSLIRHGEPSADCPRVLVKEVRNVADAMAESSHRDRSHLDSALGQAILAAP